MSQVESNRDNIQANRRKIFEAESAVMANKAKAYATRSVVEENRLLVMRNYSAAFMGNRQLANQNTEDMFRNREAIINNIEVDGAVQENFVESMLNETKLDYLEHRAELNASVLAVNEKMVAANSLLIEINEMIMSSNESIKNFNAEQIETNRKWLDGDLSSDGSTADSNAARIASNSSRCEAVSSLASSNAAKIASLYDAADGNRAEILSNSEEISSRRAGIMDNQDGIVANQSRVSGMISG